MRADYPTALAQLNEALALGEALGDDATIGRALINLGNVYRRTGDDDLAIATAQRTFERSKMSGRRETEARALNNLGLIYAFRGRFQAALDHDERSLALKDELGLPADQVSTFEN